jgi:hypothetical protein
LLLCRLGCALRFDGSDLSDVNTRPFLLLVHALACEDAFLSDLSDLCIIAFHVYHFTAPGSSVFFSTQGCISGSIDS